MALRYHPRNLRSINLKTPPTEQFSDGDVALFVCKDSTLGARKLIEMDKKINLPISYIWKSIHSVYEQALRVYRFVII